MGVPAQANASQIYFRKETTWGVTASGGDYNALRVANFRFRQRTDTVVSNIITPTREPGDVIPVDIATEGSFDFEMDLRYGAAGTSATGPQNLFDSLFANGISAALAISQALDVTTVVAGDTCNWVGTGSIFANVRIGDWVLATGFVNPANDGWYYVSAKPGVNEITVKNPAAVAETTATTVTVEGYRYVFGSTLTGYTFEHKLGTATALYHQFLGSTMGSLTLNLAPRAVIAGSMGWLGSKQLQSTSSVAGTPVAASTQQVLNPIDSISAIYEGRQGVAETWKVASLTLNINNDFAPRSALGTIGAIGIRLGRAAVTGTMRIYAEHGAAETGGIKDMIDSYLARSSRSESSTVPGALGIVLRDTVSSPNIYSTFMLHKYFITDAPVAVGGNGEDLFLDLSFSAQVHPSTTGGANLAPVAFSIHRSS
jgi:hypothetical protein